MPKKKRVNKKIKRFKSIILDLSYRVRAAVMLFVLWLTILFWRQRIEKRKFELIKYQARIDEWRNLCNLLQGVRKIKEEKKIRRLAKELLEIEKDCYNDEERCLKNNEKLHYYLAKVFDPNIGE